MFKIIMGISYVHIQLSHAGYLETTVKFHLEWKKELSSTYEMSSTEEMSQSGANKTLMRMKISF